MIGDISGDLENISHSELRALLVKKFSNENSDNFKEEFLSILNSESNSSAAK